MYVLKTQGEMVWTVPATSGAACGNEPRCCIESRDFNKYL